MNHKIPLLVTLILLGNITWLKAQFNPEAETHLDKAIEALTTNSGLELHYLVSEVTTSSDMPISEGQLFLKKDLYRLDTDEMRVINDGRYQWIYNTADKELMIQDIDTVNVDDNNPLSVLSSYKTGYKYDIKNETAEHIVINMVSQSQYNPYMLVTVKLNKSRNEIVSIQMLLRDESSLKIDLTYVEKNKKLAQDFFNFHALQVEVTDTIDLRN